jgi:hypothetical protein
LRVNEPKKKGARSALARGAAKTHFLLKGTLLGKDITSFAAKVQPPLRNTTINNLDMMYFQLES